MLARPIQSASLLLISLSFSFPAAAAHGVRSSRLEVMQDAPSGALAPQGAAPAAGVPAPEGDGKRQPDWSVLDKLKLKR